MSSALRLRETVALQRLGNALGVRLDPDKVNAVLLEELADAATACMPIDADDPDGGRNCLPLYCLKGCHVEIVHGPEEAAAVDAKYRAENDEPESDPPRSPLVGE